MDKSASTTRDADQSERFELAFEASGHIETMVNVLMREMSRCEDGQELSRFTDMALKKIKDLNSVILSVHGGDIGRSNEELSEVVHG